MSAKRSGRSGRAEGFSYHFSRYTDGPATFWHEFESWLRAGQFLAFDSKSAMPTMWSSSPDDTLEWIFWSKNPTNLLRHKSLLETAFTLNFTLTGWESAELGAPGLERGLDLLCRSADELSPERVIWRFSPVPLDDPLSKFQSICKRVSKHGIDQAFLNFLDSNCQVPETRSKAEKEALARTMAELGAYYGVKTKVCVGAGLDCDKSVCSPPLTSAHGALPCGCAHSVDPYTINAPCAYRCTYCYADGSKTFGRGKLQVLTF